MDFAKKVVDKGLSRCYINQAPFGGHKRNEVDAEKFFEKKIKKVLTRERTCDILIELPPRGGRECTLKIEQCKNKAYAK